jgi:drug/metabolite transporter (DMT)-like permease
MASETNPTVLVTAAPAAARVSLFPAFMNRWWMAFAASAVFVVSGHLLIKGGLNSLVPAADAGFLMRVLEAFLQPYVLGGLLVYLAGTVCWMRAVSLTEISFLYPLSSVNYVLVAVASTLLFHEVISTRRAAGVALVMAGMILMNRQAQEKG